MHDDSLLLVKGKIPRYSACRGWEKKGKTIIFINKAYIYDGINSVSDRLFQKMIFFEKMKKLVFLSFSTQNMSEWWGCKRENINIDVGVSDEHVLGRSFFYTWSILPTSLTKNGFSGTLLQCMVFHNSAFSVDAFWVVREGYHCRFQFHLLLLPVHRIPKNPEIFIRPLFFIFFPHDFNCYTLHPVKNAEYLCIFVLLNNPYYMKKLSYKRAWLELRNLAIMFLTDILDVIGIPWPQSHFSKRFSNSISI